VAQRGCGILGGLWGFSDQPDVFRRGAILPILGQRKRNAIPATRKVVGVGALVQMEKQVGRVGLADLNEAEIPVRYVRFNFSDLDCSPFRSFVRFKNLPGRVARQALTLRAFSPRALFR